MYVHVPHDMCTCMYRLQVLVLLVYLPIQVTTMVLPGPGTCTIFHSSYSTFVKIGSGKFCTLNTAAVDCDVVYVQQYCCSILFPTALLLPCLLLNVSVHTLVSNVVLSFSYFVWCNVFPERMLAILFQCKIFQR